MKKGVVFMRFAIGICSVTFRQKSLEEIVDLAAQGGLDCIEWGGDVHVPPGEEETARRAAALTRDRGLKVSSYGSYYRGEGDFSPVVQSALALEAPVIRVWAGTKPWEECSPQERQRLGESFRRAGEQAGKAGLRLAFEYHRGTATQTLEGAKALLELVDLPNVTCYWQPNPDISLEERLREIQGLRPWLSHVHVFAWTGANVRHPLAEGEREWTQYLAGIQEAPGDRSLLLEFVRDDSQEAFLEDAAVLRRWAETLE
jgi:3-dehydroshikimate dehydratase